MASYDIGGTAAVTTPAAAGVAVLGVAEAVAVASGAIVRAVPQLLWVEGEVEGLTRSRAGHWYWSLHGDGARLAVCAFGRDASAITRTLAAARVPLADGLSVRVRGTLGVYAPRGQLQLRASAIDPAVTVGAAVMARRRVRARLDASGLARRQAGLRPPTCPLRVAVVAPPGRGLEDFVALLEASPWAWQVQVAAAPSEGDGAPAAIAAAIGRIAGADLIVVTRGGGAGATSAYDTFEVAAAVCAAPTPVVVAVGHNADASVAGDVAWRTLSTPTAAGKFCVELLECAERSLLDTAGAVVAAGRACVDHDATQLEALASAITSRAAASRGQATLARWQRAVCLAVLIAIALAVIVVVLLVIR